MSEGRDCCVFLLAFSGEVRRAEEIRETVLHAYIHLYLSQFDLSSVFFVVVVVVVIARLAHRFFHRWLNWANFPSLAGSLY